MILIVSAYCQAILRSKRCLPDARSFTIFSSDASFGLMDWVQHLFSFQNLFSMLHALPRFLWSPARALPLAAISLPPLLSMTDFD